MQLQQMGCDPLAVMNLLNTAGVLQDDMNVVFDAMQKGPGYVNPLKLQKAQTTHLMA